MQALEFWKAVTVDKSDFRDDLLAFLQEHRIQFCVIGGQAVNAYVDPLVSLDLDFAVAVADLETFSELAGSVFHLERFSHSLNLSKPGSHLRVQIQTDPRYGCFVSRARRRDVLGVDLPVAAPEDILQGKGWAVIDASREPSRRRKDLLDIERLLEGFPDLRSSVPPAILERLDTI